MSGSTNNYWINSNTEGDGFLSYLRNSSHARNFCRRSITQLINNRQANSLLEVGVGGLNEYLSLKDVYESRHDFRFVGVDWTPQFLDEAKKRFPRAEWEQLDITQCALREELRCDIVYSQHVLEHCPGLNPALSNMLKLSRGILFNIFFLPPQEGETINFDKYPLYHNTYSLRHISQVCEHHGFEAFFEPFTNFDLPESNECKVECVLVAVRKDAMGRA